MLYKQKDESKKSRYTLGIPFLVIPVILYNIIALFSSSGVHANIFNIVMVSGASLALSWGDVIVLLAVIIVFVEMYKATIASHVLFSERALSVLLLLFCVFELLILKANATASFLVITLLCLIDVIGGYVIAVRTARRDLNIQ